MRHLTFLLLLLLLSIGCFGQEYNPELVDFDAIMDEIIIQNSNQELNYTEIYETLFQCFQHPVNLNDATEEQLNAILILSPLQVKAIVNHRLKEGYFHSIYELQSLEEFDVITIKRITPFFTVAPPTKFNFKQIKFTVPGNQNLMIKTSNKSPNDFTNPYLLLRYRYYLVDKISFGLTAKNDAGESFQWTPKKNTYFSDFSSIHFGIQNTGKIKQLILGDYKMQFGQGLVFSSGFNIDKSGDAIASVRKPTLGLRPYVSSLETGFFRGISTTIATTKNTNLTTFFSAKKIDASMDTISGFEPVITAINTAGIHVSSSELYQKANATEISWGGNYRYQFNDFSIGINLINTHFNLPIEKPKTMYHQFAFSGKRHLVGSLEFSYQWQNYSTFGEFGISKSSGVGGVIGTIASLSNKFDVAVVYRKYNKQFHSFYGNAFGESSTNTNEEGLYFGFKYKVSGKIMLSAYTDRFVHQWLSYQVNAPSKGSDLLLKIIYSPRKNCQLSSQYKIESKQKNSSNDTEIIPSIIPTMKQQANFVVVFAPEKPWQFKTGVLASYYHFGSTPEWGKLIYQDIQFKAQGFSISVRATQYFTDSYNARLYVHESDLPATFTMPAFSGNGMRNYLLINIKLLKAITLGSKFIFTKQYDEVQHKTISSYEIKIGLFGTF